MSRPLVLGCLLIVVELAQRLLIRVARILQDLLPPQVDIHSVALVLFPEHDELVLDLRSLIVQLPRLLLHLK